MAQGYKVVEHELGTAGMRALVLRSETSKKDFIVKLKESKRDRTRLDLIVRTLERIQFEGIERCEAIRLIRVLDGNLCYAEIKIPGNVIRVMCYVHNRGTPSAELVLLFDFDGHQGKRGQIPKPIMKRAATLASIAKATMEEEGHGN